MKIKHQFTDLHKDSKKRSKICLLCASLCMFTFTGGYVQSPRASAILAKMFEKLDGRGGKIKFLTWPSI